MKQVKTTTTARVRVRAYLYNINIDKKVVVVLFFYLMDIGVLKMYGMGIKNICISCFIFLLLHRLYPLLTLYVLFNLKNLPFYNHSS